MTHLPPKFRRQIVRGKLDFMELDTWERIYTDNEYGWDCSLYAGIYEGDSVVIYSYDNAGPGFTKEGTRLILGHKEVVALLGWLQVNLPKIAPSKGET